MKLLKHTAAAAALLAVVFSAPALGQTQGAGQNAAAGADSKAKPADSKRARSRSNVDARHCLKFPTNMEIHRCAHKYL